MKKLHQIIKLCIDNGTWPYMVAASDWAFQKDIQYTLYSLVNQMEPDHKYGYRKRILYYLAHNRVVTLGGAMYCPMTLMKIQ